MRNTKDIAWYIAEYARAIMDNTLRMENPSLTFVEKDKLLWDTQNAAKRLNELALELKI